MQHFWSKSHWNPPPQDHREEIRWHWPLLLFFKVTFPIYLIPSRNVWKNSWLRCTLDFKIYRTVDPPRRSHAFGVRFAPQKWRFGYATAGNSQYKHIRIVLTTTLLQFVYRSIWIKPSTCAFLRAYSQSYSAISQLHYSLLLRIFLWISYVVR
jgi:hypothetical protein